jgi:hypothetical protein
MGEDFWDKLKRVGLAPPKPKKRRDHSKDNTAYHARHKQPYRNQFTCKKCAKAVGWP